MSITVNDLKDYKWLRLVWIFEYLKLEEKCMDIIDKYDVTVAEYERWKNGDLFYKSKYLTILRHQKELLKQMNEYESEIKSIQSEMRKVVEDNRDINNIENDILIKKYTEKKSLKSIADELMFSHSYIRSKHALIRKKLDF